MKQLVLALVSASLLAACAIGGPELAAPTHPATSIATAQSNASSSVPTPDPTLTGSIRGRLLYDDGSTIEPVKDRILYLAEVITDASGTERIASLNRTSSPRTTLDADGNFSFSGVAPGRYGLVMDLVVQAFILLEPSQEEALLFDVEAGGRVDLGELIYTSLPPGAMQH